jgi:hypothetical protein
MDKTTAFVIRAFGLPSTFVLRHFSALPSDQDENAGEQSQNAHDHNVNDDCMEDRSDAI